MWMMSGSNPSPPTISIVYKQAGQKPRTGNLYLFRDMYSAHSLAAMEKTTPHIWYGYTGRSVIAATGRAIAHVLSAPAQLDAWQRRAAGWYEGQPSRYFLRHVPRETFIAAMIAPLAMQDNDKEKVEAFTSLAEVLSLLDGLDITQVALNLYNGRQASRYAKLEEKVITEKLAEDFASGMLLTLPRDTARLYEQEVLRQLPGMITYQLLKTQEEHKAFTHYLRRGAPPVLSQDVLQALATQRPVMRTWETELNRESHYQESAV
jgi:hypothetical protein